MPPLPRSIRRALALAAAVALSTAAAQPLSPALYAQLRWRMIGPHRGGRTVAGAGVPGQPGVFYIGVNDGGVWRTNDYGRVWTPLFDDQPTGSIGALAVAPSDPRIVYVGSGEGLQRPDLSTGDGIYRSADGGRTWAHLGLRDGQQIPAIIVDPRDPDRLFVAVLGHPYGPNEERGIFRSTDGGRTFQKVLYKDADTGGMDLAFDPADPQTVYAVLYAARQAPWEIHGSFTLSRNNGLYKSTDGGATWRQLTRGLPGATEGLGRIGIEAARGKPGRLYAVASARRQSGIYRSDDAGESWTRVNDDWRLCGRDGDFDEIRADPKDPDTVYVANVVTWKSTDGGKTFTAWRGAPGGDDYHRLWIDPADPRVILLTSDQGAIVTVNGGQTWSSWYNQPTAQMFHVSTDSSFPYFVCGGQQDSGSACVRSRGDDGQLTFRDWSPVGVEEYGYAVPDPLNPDLIYGGRLTRFDRRTGQVQSVGPRALRGPDYRLVRTQPVVFSPVDPHVLYFASNVLWRTADGGRTWAQLSPDLTRGEAPVPANLGAFAPVDPEKGRHRGVIYAIAPSHQALGRIWVGTDDGLIHLTSDGGKHWHDITPGELRDRPWSKVSVLEASHSDPDTAYAAVNTFRLDDLRPYVYRTRDGGRTWTRITTGLPDGAIVNVVREDPRRKGLLFAGTEREVYVSFDDGDHWQSLRLNMPATSIRDLVIKDDDVVVATHGRSFWILDDIAPLRQLAPDTAAQRAVLFTPQEAYRVRWNQNTDTPLPPDEPTARNPPEGALLDYALGAPAQEVTLEILDAAGAVVRRYASTDPATKEKDEDNIPAQWIRPAPVLATSAGVHRFVWDLHGAAPAVLHREYPIAAVVHDTPREPRGPWALPGRYTVRLTVDGQRSTQPLTVKMDPRVRLPATELARQHASALELADALQRDVEVLEQVRATHARLGALASGAQGELAPVLAALDRQLGALEGRADDHGDDAAFTRNDLMEDDLARLNDQLAALYGTVQETDAAPTPAVIAAIVDRKKALEALAARWSTLKTHDVPALEEKLRGATRATAPAP